MTFSTHPPFFMKSLNNKLLTHQFKNYSSTWASLTDKPICVTEMNGATQSSTQLLGKFLFLPHQNPVHKVHRNTLGELTGETDL